MNKKRIEFYFYIKKNAQLDFFIYPSLVIQSTIIFLILALLLHNPLIMLFKNLRVRYKLTQELSKEENRQIYNTCFDKGNFELIEKEISEKLSIINKIC